MNNIKIRKMKTSDKLGLLKLLKRTAMFSRQEIKIAAELMDSYLKNACQGDYRIYVAEISDGTLAGYVCYGPTPCTENTYDIYWIAVDPSLQGRGLGGKLLRFAESKIAVLGGKMIIVETSSTKRYKETRKFYLAKLYRIGAVIKDFYKKGDDKIIFIKRISKNYKLREGGNGKMEKTAA
ncbi:MAG TPA: GNAT family N-acetyltransferase [Victivallales bacterium]|nr:GNAT family N-acetyltransferase [Victivallales bacterium]